MSPLIVATVLVAMAPFICLAQNQEKIFIDFRSSKDTREVLQSFEKVNVLHQFKVLGSDRYLIVIKNDQSKDVKSLVLPQDASMVRSMPIESQDVFHSHFDNSSSQSGDSESLPLPDTNLTFVERTWSMEYNEKELKAIIKEHSEVAKTKDLKDVKIYVAAGTLPIKHIMFMSRSDEEAIDMLLKDVDIFGGYKRLQIDVQKIYKISKNDN